MNKKNGTFGRLIFILVAILLIILICVQFKSEVEVNNSEEVPVEGSGGATAYNDTQELTVIESDDNEISENESNRNETYYLPVIETTDIHGYMVDISSGDESTYEYRLAYIAKKIDDIRGDGDALLLDTGDFYQGNVMSNMLNGQPIRAYLDTMGYDAACLGNHEFDWGLDATIDTDSTVGAYHISDDISGDSNIPVLCWDLYGSDNQKTEYTRDYVILDKKAKNIDGQEKTIKIAVFGYIDDYSSSVAKSQFKGYSIKESDIADIEETARELEDTGMADVSVVLSHVSPENMDKFADDNSVVDLVLCGHTHEMDMGTLHNGVPFLLGGGLGGGYASATLAINTTDDNITSVEVENRETVNITYHPNLLYDTPENRANMNLRVLEISHASLELLNSENPDVTKQLGYITTELTNKELKGSIGENLVTNWAASMMADAVGAEVGVINSTGVRSEIALTEGEDKHIVTGADIYTMFPFGNGICKYDITYAQLKRLCEQTTLNSYSYLGISGICAYFEGGGDDGGLTKLYLGNELIYDNGWIADKNEIVTVAVNSYVAGFDNLCFIKLKTLNDPKKDIDNIMIIKYLEENYGASGEIPVDESIHLVELD